MLGIPSQVDIERKEDIFCEKQREKKIRINGCAVSFRAENWIWCFVKNAYISRRTICFFCVHVVCVYIGRFYTRVSPRITQLDSDTNVPEGFGTNTENKGKNFSEKHE